jgi:23S rRNA (cytosine1962-C5)-methyltransferase
MSCFRENPSLDNFDTANIPAVVLKPGREAPVARRRHPWIFSQAVAEHPAETSGVLPVRSADGKVVGWGFYTPGSLIAVRMMSFSPEKPAEGWMTERIREAIELRHSFGLDTDALRLVNAEGDFFPGLIVDRYGDTAVVSAHVKGVEAELERIVACLEEKAGTPKVFLKRDEHVARVEKLAIPTGYLSGEGDGTRVIREGKVRFLVDFARGQKTGYYLDQRRNRSIIGESCVGKRVLNLFSYTGAVALQAAAGGAARVISVESSARAVEASRENARLNADLRSEVFEWAQGDAFAFLESDSGLYDVLIADPPPFARRRAELAGAIRGYIGLFHLCFKRLAPHGFAFLFSCSGAVDRETFLRLVTEAAIRCGRRARLLRELHADVDHPVAAGHVEGEYLKGWMVYVE